MSEVARPPLIECPHCGSLVPSGDFCGHCGAHLTSDSPRRIHAYAAAPAQRVIQFAMITTLFPHLPHRRSGPFRLALLAGAVLVAALGVLHLFAPATAAAVFLLPVLYLIYLYEVEVYESEPWLVIGATLVFGALLGVAFANVFGAALAQLELTADNTTAFVLAGIVIPVVSQALMLAGPLFLYAFRGRFREPLDGLTFGAASALGFTLATSLTQLWPLLAGPLLSDGSTLDWSIRLTRVGLLSMLINASTTALVTAALWLHRFALRTAARPWHTTILAALILAFGVQIGLGIVGFLVPNAIVDSAILAVAALALLFYLRLAIHDALLVEGAEHEIGPDGLCPECHHVVPTMAFCPSCGASRAAASKQGRPRLARGA